MATRVVDATKTAWPIQIKILSNKNCRNTYKPQTYGSKTQSKVNLNRSDDIIFKNVTLITYKYSYRRPACNFNITVIIITIYIWYQLLHKTQIHFCNCMFREVYTLTTENKMAKNAWCAARESTLNEQKRTHVIFSFTLTVMSRSGTDYFIITLFHSKHSRRTEWTFCRTMFIELNLISRKLIYT